jgi:hypothetical protein
VDPTLTLKIISSYPMTWIRFVYPKNIVNLIMNKWIIIGCIIFFCVAVIGLILSSKYSSHSLNHKREPLTKKKHIPNKDAKTVSPGEKSRIRNEYFADVSSELISSTVNSSTMIGMPDYPACSGSSCLQAGSFSSTYQEQIMASPYATYYPSSAGTTSTGGYQLWATSSSLCTEVAFELTTMSSSVGASPGNPKKLFICKDNFPPNPSKGQHVPIPKVCLWGRTPKGPSDPVTGEAGGLYYQTGCSSTETCVTTSTWQGYDNVGICVPMVEKNTTPYTISGKPGSYGTSSVNNTSTDLYFCGSYQFPPVEANPVGVFFGTSSYISNGWTLPNMPVTYGDLPGTTNPTSGIWYNECPINTSTETLISIPAIPGVPGSTSTPAPGPFGGALYRSQDTGMAITQCPPPNVYQTTSSDWPGVWYSQIGETGKVVMVANTSSACSAIGTNAFDSSSSGWINRNPQIGPNLYYCGISSSIYDIPYASKQNGRAIGILPLNNGMLPPLNPPSWWGAASDLSSWHGTCPSTYASGVMPSAPYANSITADGTGVQAGNSFIQCSPPNASKMNWPSWSGVWYGLTSSYGEPGSISVIASSSSLCPPASTSSTQVYNPGQYSDSTKGVLSGVNTVYVRNTNSKQLATFTGRYGKCPMGMVEQPSVDGGASFLCVPDTNVA